ncbi:site-specific integrase [Aeromonas caviae]|uniref:site-specific integrase n=1 Tax=Aeromonas caviae TaxID=648 RepID=UPI0029D8E562|nr:site-specific integrase [Aeromonas caviae]MDX7853002.1 site-specific integrase [Aeromonas caviae]
MKIIKNRVTLSKALGQYLERVSVHKKGFAQERYRIAPILSHDISKLYLDEISSVDIASYRDDRLAIYSVKTKRPLSPNTVRLELALLSDLFSIAQIEWGACLENPVSLVRKPRLPDGRDRRLRPREEGKLLRAALARKNPEVYSIIVIAIETGMRQGEILGMRWENLDMRLGVAHLLQTKNGSKRDVPLTVRAREAFSRLGVQQDGPIFHYTPSGFKSIWKAMIRRLGITDLHFHDLRHEAISRMFELGTLDMVEVAAISGHRSLQMLKRYTHLRAHKLVAKLEKNRKRMRRHLLGFPAYPAFLFDEKGESSFRVEFVDFDDLSLSAESRTKALLDAKDILLREIANCIKDGKTLPVPSEVDDVVQFTPAIGHNNVVLIDPL